MGSSSEPQTPGPGGAGTLPRAHTGFAELVCRVSLFPWSEGWGEQGPGEELLQSLKKGEVVGKLRWGQWLVTGDGLRKAGPDL